MALYRATEGFVIGRENGPDLKFIEGKAYDDRNREVKDAIARFPDYFTDGDK